MAELVDALGLGPNASRHGGSSPSARTIQIARNAGDLNAKTARAPASSGGRGSGKHGPGRARNAGDWNTKPIAGLLGATAPLNTGFHLSRRCCEEEGKQVKRHPKTEIFREIWRMAWDFRGESRGPLAGPVSGR